MLKRLLLSLLLMAALTGGWRPAVAGLHEGAKPAVAEAEHAHSSTHDRMICADADRRPAAPFDAGDGGHMTDMSRCAAMASGCAAPLLEAGMPDVARKGEALRLHLWDRPSVYPTPVALAPDPRPPRPSL
jgi:hypothetical protein